MDRSAGAGRCRPSGAWGFSALVPVLRRSRREEAQTIPTKGDQSLLTSAPTNRQRVGICVSVSFTRNHSSVECPAAKPPTTDTKREKWKDSQQQRQPTVAPRANPDHRREDDEDKQRNHGGSDNGERINSSGQDVQNTTRNETNPRQQCKRHVTSDSESNRREVRRFVHGSARLRPRRAQRPSRAALKATFGVRRRFFVLCFFKIHRRILFATHLAASAAFWEPVASPVRASSTEISFISFA